MPRAGRTCRSSGSTSRHTAPSSLTRGCWSSGVASISPARCSRSHRRARRRISNARLPTIPSCAGCSTRSRVESSTRSPRFERSLTRCSILATETTGPTLTEIEAARRGLADVARVTPVYASDTFSRLAAREVVLKAENLQRTGSFKVRGAVTRIAALTKSQRAAGVVAASAGNHGQAVAWAAREGGIPAAIFVPRDAPMAKVEACRNYSADTELVGLTFEDALAAAFAYAEETGATFVHPYEDEAVIAGQGTIGLELAEQVPQAETVLVPVGGGGRASGIASARRAVKPKARVVGREIRRDRYTIADGIAVQQPCELNSAILEDVLDDMVTVSDEEISE